MSVKTNHLWVIILIILISFLYSANFRKLYFFFSGMA